MSAERPPEGARAISLTQGFDAWVDFEDYERLALFVWYARRTRHRVYALASVGGVKVYMHREIMRASKGQEIDHKSHDLLRAGIIDNRKANLRLADASQNQANRRKGRGSSIFKGVSWKRLENKWGAYIGSFPTRWNLGTYREEAAAAPAYDLAAVRRFGDFALTNFPVPGSQRWIYGSPHALAAAIDALR